jgi:hypothetical protein
MHALERPVSFVAAAALAALGVVAWVHRQPSIALQLVLFSALACLAIAVSPRNARRPGATLAVTVAVVVNAWGFAYDLFERIYTYDEVAHGYTLFAGAYWIGVALPPSMTRPAFVAGALTAGTTLGLGALWEILEWTAGALINAFDMDLDDTLSDLLYGAAGAAIGAWVALAPPRATARRRRQTTPRSEVPDVTTMTVDITAPPR